MPRGAASCTNQEQEFITQLGERIAQARLARGWSIDRCARSARVAPNTWRALERNPTSVQFALVVRAMLLLGLHSRLNALVELDPLVVALLERAVPKRGTGNSKRESASSITWQALRHRSRIPFNPTLIDVDVSEGFA